MAGGTSGAVSAVGWLLRAAPVPGVALAEWDGSPDGAAALAIGLAWDVVHARIPLGLEALDMLRYAGAVGPALVCVPEAMVSVLVPTGSAECWAGFGPRPIGVTVAGRGGRLRVPLPSQTYGPLHWLIPPDGSGLLTDPRRLHAALRKARMTTRDPRG
ncbi:hypothetical protein [Peterkaempfera bronchialis]|uniref:Uncharacterized protein n=1 Tax=Peterkaempfera bronchialis TaxID=2126346 RepID=A0A345ST18_9ACTN|nr:hypothetical protein [Peterkaempfera bronchialis]AXI76873.1 hypothetical protein C7M71_004795 [Peterkaempfera bronchialis]